MTRRCFGVTVSEQPGVSRRKPQTASGRSMSSFDFDSAFEGLTGNPPFPWQRRLFADRFFRGEIPAAIEIPTGLGGISRSDPRFDLSLHLIASHRRGGGSAVWSSSRRRVDGEPDAGRIRRKV